MNFRLEALYALLELLAIMGLVLLAISQHG